MRRWNSLTKGVLLAPVALCVACYGGLGADADVMDSEGDTAGDSGDDGELPEELHATARSWIRVPTSRDD